MLKYLVIVVNRQSTKKNSPCAVYISSTTSAPIDYFFASSVMNLATTGANFSSVGFVTVPKTLTIFHIYHEVKSVKPLTVPL